MKVFWFLYNLVRHEINKWRWIELSGVDIGDGEFLDSVTASDEMV